MKKILLLIALSFFISFTASSQELPTIVPLSPNAASISKYGEIPVGHFTGSPNIGIPLYTIKSRELSLPLSLSYHGGGNRVETVASWVGLGWSLGSIPSISRNVRGITDENGGFFGKYSGKTAEEILNLGPGNSIYNSYIADLFSGTADSEPDIFNYSLPEDSGKFFYDQSSETFITYPKSNTKIIREGTGFRLISQNGIEYVFNMNETTQSGSGNPVNSSWYASRMISSSKKDSIRFTYQQEGQITKTKNVVIKYHHLGGISNGSPSNEGSILSTNLNNAKLVDSIIFSNGYVKFNRNTSERQDLKNGYSLNNVSVYNNQNSLITKYEFTYRFVSGTGTSGSGTACYNADSYSKKWMFLDKVEQIANDSSKKLSHSFTYNESYLPGCRYSAAQDYWGYYNGSDSNSNLTPTYYLPNSNTQIAGADRSVNPTKSKYGILTKIIYPTKGYTEFDFENNMVSADDLQPQYVTEDQMLAGDEYIDWDETLDGTDSYQKTFTINNPPDIFLNNNNPNGGANVNFEFFNPGCDLSSGLANNCARFTVNGPSINTTDITVYGATFYLANGTYTMTASFDQSPAQYQDFIFIAEWNKIDPNQTGNFYAGGLRIKEIRNYSSASAQPITKKYKYTKAYNSTESSGDIFSNPNFSHQDIINYFNDVLPQGGVGGSIQLRLRSISNIQQVTHSGSPVGYKTVFEETDDPNETGYSEYQFSHARDNGYDVFPYPPFESRELDRGQLLEEKQYKKSINGFDLVQKRSLNYTSSAFLGSSHPKYSSAIKWGNSNITEYSTGGGAVNLNSAEILLDYEVLGGWNNLLKETVKNYYDNDSIVTVTSHSYGNNTHLLKTSSQTTNSNGSLISSSIKYPLDITSPTAPVIKLINQNRIGEQIEVETINNGELQKQFTVFEDWGNNILLPEFMQTSKGNSNLENRIIYHDYDDKGNPVEVSKTDGTSIFYIWGYNQQYPIAKIENATYSQVSTHISNLETLSNADNDRTIDTYLNGSRIYSGNEGTFREALNNLRTQLSNAMVSTYTYDPLIGVTSMTDPRGYTMYYEYDEFNRLKRVKDAEGNIMSQNEYHYKDQE